MERDLFFNFFVLIFIDFNSHAHVERDLVDIFLVSDKNIISTHTLTWSVTLTSFSAFLLITAISTHTLTWSVTFV